MASGGPLKSVTLNGRTFPIDGEVDAAKAKNGYINEVKPNGDETNRLIKSRKTGRLNTVPIVIDDARDDETFIQEQVLDQLELIPIDYTDVNGNVWSGTGQVVEDPETSTKEGVKNINISGNFNNKQ